MKNQTLYTAVGHFRRRTTADGTYPVVVVNGQEHRTDLQEMTVWTCLSWRLLTLDQLRELYLQKAESLPIRTTRSLADCTDRLVTRGLAASGSGRTGYEALYALIAGLFVVPVSSSLFLRTLAFAKLTLLEHIPFSKTSQLFRADRPNPDERRILELSRQALLSTAELIKCVEAGVFDLSSDEKLLTALYGGLDAATENLPYLMRDKPSARSVIAAVANLYLRQQVIFQRL